MTYHEPPDIRTGKAPRHQDASIKNWSGKTPKINPARTIDMESANKILSETYKIIKIIKSKDVPESFQEKWIEEAIDIGVGAIAKKIKENKYIDSDIKTLEKFNESAKESFKTIHVEKRHRKLSEKEIEKKKEKKWIDESLSAYERKIRQTLINASTEEAKEWEMTNYRYMEKGSAGCQLCGHAPIKNIYTITKTSGKNQGISLDIGSECVVNYLHIPIKDVTEFAKKVKFEEKDRNLEVELESLLDRINKMTDLKRTYENREWQIYHKWKGKGKSVETSQKMLREKGHLTPARLKKMEDMIKDALQDEEFIEKAGKEKEAKKIEIKDKYHEMMEESVEFHEKNSFLRDIYKQWERGYELSEAQINAFEKTLEQYKQEKLIAIESEKLGEIDGINEIEGKVVNIKELQINGNRRFSFDIITEKGTFHNISVMEWDKRNFKIVNDMKNGDYEASIQYEFKEKKYRNLTSIIVDMKIEPQMSQIDPTLDISIFHPIVPRPWQSAHFTNWWNKKRGVVQAGTGAGKTKFAIMAIQKMLYEKPNATIVVAVPTMVLQDQWEEELSNIGIKSTLVGGGHGEKFGQVTIGIYNTLWNKKIYADLLIGDEAHHLSQKADLNFSIWKDNINTIDRILFLTATPGKELLKDLPLITVVSQEELQSEGSLSSYNIINVPLILSPEEFIIYKKLDNEAKSLLEQYGWENNWTKLSSGNRYRWVTNHPIKIKKVADISQKLLSEGKKIIVFFTMIDTIYKFKKEMHLRGIPISIDHSSRSSFKISKKERTDNMNRFKNNETMVLAGAYAIGEGVNVPNADVAIIAGGSQQEREFIQRSGRVLRQIPGKESAEIYQIFLKETMEEKWVQKRTFNVSRNAKIRELMDI